MSTMVRNEGRALVIGTESVSGDWADGRLPRVAAAMGRARTQFLVINQGGHPVYHDDTNPSAWEAATQASAPTPSARPQSPADPSPRAGGTLSPSP